MEPCRSHLSNWGSPFRARPYLLLKVFLVNKFLPDPFLCRCRLAKR
jgi:hypothetical protein